MRTVWNDNDRFESTYFSKVSERSCTKSLNLKSSSQFPGFYCTGDGARRDADGYLWITGRVDDMVCYLLIHQNKILRLTLCPLLVERFRSFDVDR